MTPPLIIHCSYHKTGSGWFEMIFRKLAKSQCWELVEQKAGDISERTKLFLDNHSSVKRQELPPHICSHMIRDPRDVAVSGYYYHRHSEEWWLLVPCREHGWLKIDSEKTYQQLLNELPFEEGLKLEIDHLASATLRSMLAWDYSAENTLELKYEEVYEDYSWEKYEVFFERLFAFYGFTGDTLGQAREIARECSFERLTGRKPGVEEEERHLRNAASGQWQTTFPDHLKSYFSNKHGEALQKLGYS